MKGVVIIGSGHAGCNTAINLRRAGFSESIKIFSKENYYPYHRPPLSKKFFKGDLTEENILLKNTTFYEDNNIEIHLNTFISEVDIKNNFIRTTSGDDYEFSYLVFATGTSSRVFADNMFPGIDIFYLRNIDDVKRIQTALTDNSKPLLIGGGYIGLELAASMQEMGHTVSIIELEDRLLKRVTAPIMSTFFQDLHESKGVNVLCNQSIQSIKVDKKGNYLVTTDNGTIIDTNILIAGIGAIPNDDLAQNAGIKCKNGILIDEYCRTNVPHVFAAGDCANGFNNLLGYSIRLESVPNANAQAKVVASSIIGNEDLNRELPWFWSDQYDLKLQMAGLSNGYDDVYIQGKIEDNAFIVCYGKKGNLIAVDSVNMPKIFNNYKKALSNGMRLSMELVSDSNFDPASLFSASY
jgi:3-phenylpropionate/trans-cinnamate dioxygenase ferredoxin reductase subunit